MASRETCQSIGCNCLLDDKELRRRCLLAARLRMREEVTQPPLGELTYPKTIGGPVTDSISQKKLNTIY